MSTVQKHSRTWYTVTHEDKDFNLMFEPTNDGDDIIFKKVGRGWEVGYLNQDEMAESPDEWKDESLLLVNYHRDFDVRRDDIITEDDVRAIYQNQFIRGVLDSGEFKGIPISQDQRIEWQERITEVSQEDFYWIFPLSCYSHSGVVLHLGGGSNMWDSGGWDTSHVGVVLASKKEFPDFEKSKVEEIADGLVKTWNQYLSGDVYCVVVEKFDSDLQQFNYDICGGYYGYKDTLKELASQMGVKGE